MSSAPDAVEHPASTPSDTASTADNIATAVENGVVDATKNLTDTLPAYLTPEVLEHSIEKDAMSNEKNETTATFSNETEYGPDSHQLMIDAARMSRMAYMDPVDVARYWEDLQDGRDVTDYDTAALLKQLKRTPVFLNDTQSDAQGYGLVYKTANANDVAVLAFRGTSSFADALADSQIPLVPLKSASVQVPPDLLVHRGFLGQFLRLEKDCDTFLKQTGLSDVLCVGHSLGSACSAIAASVYGLQDYKVTYIGHGQPRPGSSGWAAVFNKVVQWCVVFKNGRDCISSIVAPIVYSHVGEARHVGRADPFPDLCLLWDIVDHPIDLYLAHIKLNDTTPETPKAWLPYIYGLLYNTPVRLWFAVRNFTFT